MVVEAGLGGLTAWMEGGPGRGLEGEIAAIGTAIGKGGGAGRTGIAAGRLGRSPSSY